MLKCQQFLLINVKMPLIVGILTFMSRKNSPLGLSEPKNADFFLYFHIYEHLKFHAQLSWAWKKFYNLKAWDLSLMQVRLDPATFSGDKDQDLLLQNPNSLAQTQGKRKNPSALMTYSESSWYDCNTVKKNIKSKICFDRVVREHLLPSELSMNNCKHVDMP